MQVGSAQTQHRRARPDALLRIVEAGAVLEVPISDHHFPVVSAFNDMSLHLFPATGVQLPVLPLEGLLLNDIMHCPAW